jgi:hypothetical protein
MAYPADLGLTVSTCETERNACDHHFVLACPDCQAGSAAIGGEEGIFAVAHLPASVLHRQLNAWRAEYN